MQTRTRTRKHAAAKPTRRKARVVMATERTMNRRTNRAAAVVTQTHDPQAWRSTVDWAAAGKKAAETRRRNLLDAGKTPKAAKAAKAKRAPKPKAPVTTEDHTAS
jgi:YD repeat-containing protein